MVPLALTSTQWSIRKLGKKWQTLHRLIYFSAAAGVIHFIWLVKRDKEEPVIYGMILCALMVIRVYYWARSSRRKAVPAARTVNVA